MATEKRELLIYLVSVFVVTFLMGIPLMYSYRNGLSVQMFPLIQMLYPAAGVMFAYLITRKNDPQIPKKRFIFYIAMVLISIVILIGATIFHTNIDGILELSVVIAGIVFILIVFKEDRKNTDAFGLTGGTKEWLKYGCLFVVLYLANVLFITVVSGEISEITKYITADEVSERLMSIIFMPFMFLIQPVFFFGEEYGWRYFLQGRLQNIAGKRAGVILTGIIWGLWHMPLDFAYYLKPEYGLIGVVSHQITCISLGIFFGYVYMKTKSVWIVSFLHYINNMMSPIIYGIESIEPNQSASWDGMLIYFVASFLFYGVFILSKEFRKES